MSWSSLYSLPLIQCLAHSKYSTKHVDWIGITWDAPELNIVICSVLSVFFAYTLKVPSENIHHSFFTKEQHAQHSGCTLSSLMRSTTCNHLLKFCRIVLIPSWHLIFIVAKESLLKRGSMLKTHTICNNTQGYREEMHVDIGVGPDIIYKAFPFVSVQVWSETGICLWYGRSPETQRGWFLPSF